MLRLVLSRLIAYAVFGWIAMFGFLGAQGGFGKRAALHAVPAGLACGVAVAISAAWRSRRGA
jgi:hypothetical protein